MDVSLPSTQGHAKPLRQLQFLEQLLTVVPGCEGLTERESDNEALLNELLTHMLRPTLSPWPAHIKYVLNVLLLRFAQFFVQYVFISTNSKFLTIHCMVFSPSPV